MKARNANEYITRDIYAGSIDLVWAELNEFKKMGLKVKTVFNGKCLYSDMTLNEAYKEITGMTHKECQQRRQNALDELKKEREDYNQSVPILIEKYKKNGAKLIDSSKLQVWEQIVESSINSGLYKGSDLDAVLELLPLTNRADWDKAAQLFRKQEHSGCSARLVCNDLLLLLEGVMPNHTEFVNYVFRMSM